MGSIEPRTALVTAAASGLARGVAIALARAGFRVAITYRPGGTPPDQTLAAIGADGAPLAFAADHALRGATGHAVQEAERQLGGIGVLVHAAGPIIVKSFASSSLDDYDAMVNANLGSAVEAAFAVLPGMRERGYGRIVFFGMNGSDQTHPAPSMSLYAAAKAGVVAFARSLAAEEARRGVTVNVVQPGDVRDKTADRAQARSIPAGNPTGHAGSWEDIADAVRFLVSDDAGFINGVALSVNGGLVGPHE